MRPRMTREEAVAMARRLGGWRIRAEIAVEDAGWLVEMHRCPPGQPAEFRAAWLAANGGVVWDARVDGRGCIVDDDGVSVVLP